jgi:hypothetical protein
MMPYLTSRVTWTAFVLLGAYFVATAYIPVPNSTIYEVLHTLRVSAGLAVWVAYCEAALQAVRMSRPDHIRQLALGIVATQTGIVGAAIWGLLWRLGGKPDWMLESSMNGVWWWITILGSVLHITAPGAINGSIPTPNKIRLGIAIGTAVGAAMLIMVLRPDLRPIVDMMEPWFRE